MSAEALVPLENNVFRGCCSEWNLRSSVGRSFRLASTGWHAPCSSTILWIDSAFQLVGASVPCVTSSAENPSRIVGDENDRPSGLLRSAACGLSSRGTPSLRELMCERLVRWIVGAASCEPTYVGPWSYIAPEVDDRAEVSLAYASPNKKSEFCKQPHTATP